jgi:hypothetical protein
MPALRHASRHLMRTVQDRVEAQLQTLGWLGPTVPFGTTPVTIYSRRLRESELVSITGNIVGIFFGQETEDAEAELGGGILVTSTDLFVDIVAVNDPIGLALASDIKDFLSGRIPGAARMFPLRDYTTNPTGDPRDDHMVEVVGASRQRPENVESKLFWQVVTAGLELSFPGEA